MSSQLTFNNNGKKIIKNIIDTCPVQISRRPRNLGL